MSNETVTKSARFYCVSLTPDICKTPIGPSTPPLPYIVIGEFSEASNASPNVKSHGKPVILHQRSTIPSVKGDAAGSAGGVKSGTVGKQVDTKTASSAHRANGAAKVQVGREVWMNARNTIGKIYERGGEMARPLLRSLASQTRRALKEAAQTYKDEYSADTHNVAAGLTDAGGNAMTAGAVLGAAGAVAIASVVAAPVGLAAEPVAVAVGGVGVVVSAVGGAVEVGATALDQAADFVITGQTPDLLASALDAAANLGLNIAQARALKYLGPMGKAIEEKLSNLLGKFKNAKLPGKKPLKTTPERPASKPPTKKGDDGKESGKPGPKADAPSDCCPRNQAPARKPVTGRKPIHFGTGQEILEQTDFVLHGGMQLAWTRTYRSGAETEDWGLFGARWSSEFTTALSLGDKGIVYHDASGRALRLPALSRGESHDDRKEGHTLTRTGADEFTLTWRDGQVDTFRRGADGWLPHGYDGVNAMLAPTAPISVPRFDLVRSAGRDGRGVSVERHPAAEPGQVLLRVVGDDGSVIEAMRSDGVDAALDRPAAGATSATSAASGATAAASTAPAKATATAAATAAAATDKAGADTPRIGRVEQVLADGTRICHVRYTYADEQEPAHPDKNPTPPSRLPKRHNLVAQTNLLGHARHYEYRHHLLTSCSSYGGYIQQLEWISLAALRSRWRGSQLDEARLANLYPVTLDNSYQARAITSGGADGSARVRIDYLDNDTTRVTENGGVLEYVFDRNWLATDVRRVTNDTATSLGKREWDKDGMLLAESGAVAPATRYAYDAAGNLTSSTDAAGNTSNIEYDAHNQPVTITDALGNVTRQSYDAAGRVSATTNALGHVTAYRYDELGRLAAIIDAKGGSKTLHYDQSGRLVAYTDCSGYATRYSYDAQDRLINISDALGQETTYAYDALGQLIRVTQPDDTSEAFEYDADGNLLTHTDAAGYQTHYRYNGLGMPVARTDALGQTLQYRYDSALQLAELINAAGESYRFTYNAEGWLTSETGFDGKPTHYTYDADGQLIASECLGQRTDLMHDSRGLLRAKTTADGTVHFAHDALGRMTMASSMQADLHFIYDPLGQLIEERSAYFLKPVRDASLVPDAKRTPDAAFVMTHAYDELGNRIKTVLPDGHCIDTLRYGSGHWHGTLWDGVPVVDIERDRLHRETRRYLGSSITRLVATRRYDKQSRIAEMTLDHDPSKAGRFKIRERKFQYDPVGNLTSIQHGWHTRDETLGRFSYTYDPIGQLLTAIQPGLTEVFAFDSLGNLTDTLHGVNVHAPTKISDPSRSSAVHERDSPLQVQKLIKRYLNHTYIYNESGNLVRKYLTQPRNAYANDDLRMTYDVENRLIDVIHEQFKTVYKAHYQYDAFNRRIAKHVTEKKWQNDQNTEEASQTKTKTTLFFWNDDVMVQELKFDKVITHLFEPDSFIPLGKFESIISTTEKPNDLEMELDFSPLIKIVFYNCDHLGSPKELITVDEGVVWRENTKAWGRKINANTYTFEQPLKFPGQYEDEETGLFYNRYRYYDPDLARYTTSDPVGLAGGLNQGIYAANPINWIDPLGLAKYAIIGEGQSGVEAYASLMSIRFPCDEFRTIKKDWKKLMQDSGAAKKTLGTIEWETIALNANANWIIQRHAEGYHFIDIGNDKSVNKSAFYIIERQTIKQIGAKSSPGSPKSIALARAGEKPSTRPKSKSMCIL